MGQQNMKDRAINNLRTCRGKNDTCLISSTLFVKYFMVCFLTVNSVAWSTALRCIMLHQQQRVCGGDVSASIITCILDTNAAPLLRLWRLKILLDCAIPLQVA